MQDQVAYLINNTSARTNNAFYGGRTSLCDWRTSRTNVMDLQLFALLHVLKLQQEHLYSQWQIKLPNVLGFVH